MEVAPALCLSRSELRANLLPLSSRLSALGANNWPALSGKGRVIYALVSPLPPALRSTGA